MTLLTFLIILVIGGLCWYLVETYVPLPAPIKTVLRVVLVLILILLILALFQIVPLPIKLA